MTDFPDEWVPVRLPKGPKRKHLVIVAAGDESCHRNWEQNLPGEQRSWDLMIIQWGPNPPAEEDADIVIRQPGYKFNLIFRLMQDIPWLQDYDYVWLSDDDIDASYANIQRMFDMAEAYHLLLAQPGLTANSPATHNICYARPEYILRYTNFVEVMVPLFSQAALKTCLPSFGKSLVGGLDLDWIWPKMLGNPTHEIAVLDAVTVHHTRPLGISKMWDSIRAAGDHYQDGLNALMAEYGIDPIKCRYYEYGYILKKPADASSESRVQMSNTYMQLSGRLVPLLCAAVSQPVPPSWNTQNAWQMPEKWAGGQPQVFPLPNLPVNNWCLSVSFTLNIPSGGLDASITDLGETILFLATPHQKERLRIRLIRENDHHFSVFILFPGAQKKNLAMRLKNLSCDSDINIRIEAFSAAGWMRLWLNGRPLRDIWGDPIHWNSANAILIGNANIRGTIRDLCLSPFPTDTSSHTGFTQQTEPQTA